MPTSEPWFIYWQHCPRCDHKALAHGGVACPDCGVRLVSRSIAGAVVEEVSDAE